MIKRAEICTKPHELYDVDHVQYTTLSLHGNVVFAILRQATAQHILLIQKGAYGA